MDEIAPILEESRVSAYMYGHRHSLSYGVANGVSYVQSGNAALSEKGCTGKGVLFSGKEGKYGFVKASIHGDGLEFIYLDKEGVVLYRTEKIPSRMSTNR
jgi:hypothetical protein